MSRTRIDGIWVLTCDWKDPATGELCDLGRDDDGQPDGKPRMVVDPDAGQSTDKHFQCGRHHGVIPQAEQEEFQVPEGHKLYHDEIVPAGTGEQNE